MGSLISVYLQLGARHIADLQGYDHILFVAALVAAWPGKQWRRLLLLVTAFTLGHSVTLALATLQLVAVNSAWVEFLIPVTIAIAALGAIRQVRGDAGTATEASQAFVWRYAGAAAFGLIHGLGFSTFLRAALGQEESIFLPLLAFNVGLELGQLLIVGVVLGLGMLVTGPLRVPRRVWVMAVSIGILVVAVRLAVERQPWLAAS